MPSEAVRTKQAGRVYDWAKQGVGGTVSPRGLKGEFPGMPYRESRSTDLFRQAWTISSGRGASKSRSPVAAMERDMDRA
ncbi:hypothetical protein SAMN06275492_11531 [Dethiosulfovibrio salsuginis]|uniref:Uncharacterized protein n=1 Tax=Dethiosulfovibrio salsuginis TaxID=561720 RepID=A0A1X7JRF4_9BACT|nr:hypothetical protein SAMN06275492_11531 [Dethiosulfovibrio salsuginis]